MSQEKTEIKRKDIWEKLDVISRMINIAFLAVIATFIKIGADNIANSIKRGELVKSLISDLTTQDIKVRQDIALIALNRSIGDSQPKLVVEIAKTILISQKDVSDLTGQQAYKIIQERDPEEAEIIRKEADNVLKNFRRDLLSPPNIEGTPKQPPPQAQRLASIFTNVVYIQYRGPAFKAEVQRFREELHKLNFHAPGVEAVEADFSNNIRFFHKEDEIQAKKVQTLAQDFFKKPFALHDFSGKFRVPRGQIEVWVNPERF